MKCCIQNCFNDNSKKTNKSQGFTFHRVPKDPYHAAAWLEAITRLGYRQIKSLTVCSLHFLPEDFDDKRRNQRRVKSGAVPTIMAVAQEERKKIQEEFTVCRVCLAIDVKMYDMKNYKLNEMFQNITGILAIDNKGSILQQVCWECAARLSAAAAFKDKALLSDALLKDLVHVNKSDIATLKQKHPSLKSHLTVNSTFTSSDIECEFSISANEGKHILQNDEIDVKARKTIIRINEKEKEMEFGENELWVEVPTKTEGESEPLDDNDILIQDRKSDTFLELISDEVNGGFTSVEEDIEDEIRNIKVKNNNKNNILRENTQNKIPILKNGKIILANDKKQKPELVIINVINEEESSSAEDLQSTAEVSLSEPKQKEISKVEAPNEKETIRTLSKPLKGSGFKHIERKVHVPVKVVQNHKVDEELKRKIISMKRKGVSVTHIANLYRVPRWTIYLWWKRWCQENNDDSTSFHTSTEQEQSCTEGASGEKSLQTPPILSSKISLWKKTPDVGCVL